VTEFTTAVEPVTVKGKDPVETITVGVPTIAVLPVIVTDPTIAVDPVTVTDPTIAVDPVTVTDPMIVVDPDTTSGFPKIPVPAVDPAVASTSFTF
jgi:hypothetical protein